MVPRDEEKKISVCPTFSSLHSLLLQQRTKNFYTFTATHQNFLLAKSHNSSSYIYLCTSLLALNVYLCPDVTSKKRGKFSPSLQIYIPLLPTTFFLFQTLSKFRTFHLFSASLLPSRSCRSQLFSFGFTSNIFIFIPFSFPTSSLLFASLTLCFYLLSIWDPSLLFYTHPLTHPPNLFCSHFSNRKFRLVLHLLLS